MNYDLRALLEGFRLLGMSESAEESSAERLLRLAEDSAEFDDSADFE